MPPLRQYTQLICIPFFDQTENKKFLERLVNTKSYFSQAEWDATREEEEILLARLRKFEYVPPKDSLAGGLRALARLISSRQATALSCSSPRPLTASAASAAAAAQQLLSRV